MISQIFKLFLWDDEIDTETGRLAGDMEAAKLYRQETIEYVHRCLGLSGDARQHSTPANEIIAFFKIIGDAVCEAYDLEHRELLFGEIEFFMETSEVEQRRRLSSELPTTEEYLATRMGTGAVNVCTILSEAAYGISIPVGVLRDAHMKVVWDQTNILVCVVNDLLSLKKEIDQQSVESIVPLLYSNVGSLAASVSMVIEIIEKSIKEFDSAAVLLLSKFADDEALVSDLEIYTDACRLNCTGNLNWSLQTGRYGVSQQTITGGVTMRLG
ncbi:(+)-eremophilene synthase [Colletotrichum shisoi]|uniref:Terpene synthase n=1 Tax=Colletotrichum shisoi TaxID=2078593 RepID=A0A5Q4BA62_9PEZI|nr:(+)-eremophilene synthase [Colletotrichum shisoi]